MVGLIGDAFVYHKRRTSLKKYFKQIFNWGVARINLSRLHKGMLKPVHMIPALLLTNGVTILLLSLFGVISNLFLISGCIGLVILALIAFFQSLLMYKSIHVALLSIVTIFLQILAYALGSLSGTFQVFVRRKEVATGYSKNYYK